MTNKLLIYCESNCLTVYRNVPSHARIASWEVFGTVNPKIENFREIGMFGRHV